MSFKLFKNNFKHSLFLFTLILFGTTAFSLNANAATEFVASVKESGGDYSSLFDWEAGLDCDLTTARTTGWDTQVGSDIADGTAVTWDGGLSTGTLHHMTTVSKSGTDSFLLSISSATMFPIPPSDT